MRWQVGKEGGVLERDARAAGGEAGEKADGQAGEDGWRGLRRGEEGWRGLRHARLRGCEEAKRPLRVPATGKPRLPSIFVTLRDRVFRDCQKYRVCDAGASRAFH